MTVQCAKCGNHLTTEHLSAGPQWLQCTHCGATVPVFDQNTLVTPLQPAAKAPASPVTVPIDGYQVLAQLGAGGMGDVYLAVQASLNRNVAIKVLSPTLLQDPDFLARFDREIAVLVRLTHPHIVTIFDRGRTAAGQVYYVMEYVEGEAGGAPLDLERMIAEGRLDSQRTREVMLQVAQALGFAHREGVVHRDVKPGNILIDRHGFAKVADFGIACLRGDQPGRSVTTANMAVGTAIYAAPEQQRDAASVDHRADIYGAGVLLYQMLTGNLPLAGYAPPSAAVPGLNRQWDAIVAKAIQPRPEDRFADMAQFEAALRALGSTAVPQPLPAPALKRSRPRTATGAGVPMVCPQCGSPAGEEDQFCVSCSVPLWHACRQCGESVFAAAKFCPGCRADLENQRVFEDYFQLAKDHLDEARPQPPCADAVRHLEQARLALGKALDCLDAADARTLLVEVNGLTVTVAWQAAEAAAAAKHLTEASYCYGQILEADPNHKLAAACLRKIVSYRSEMIGKAQTLFAEGRQKNALAMLRTAVEQFEDDEELAGLWAQYHEDSAALQDLCNRIPVLIAENRWCEVAQVAAELSTSGVPLKGLDAYAAKAQQRLATVDPTVLEARRSLDAGNTSQAVAQAQQVLQQVADHAEALEIVELGQSRERVAQRRAASRRRRQRFLAGVAGLTCLIVVCGAAYLYLTETQAVDRAAGQINAKDFQAAMQTLNALPHRLFKANPVHYLTNVARLRQYAAEGATPQPAALETAKRGFLSLFAADVGWRTRAKTELADCVDLVPPTAADALPRSAAIAGVLHEIQAAEPAALAAALVAKARQRAEAGLPLPGSGDAAYAQRIVEFDPGAADELVQLVCADRQPMDAGLSTVRAWAASDTTFASALGDAVKQYAAREAEQGRYEQAKLAIETARKLGCDIAGFWEKQFDAAAQRGDVSGAVGILGYMLQGEQDPAKLDDGVKRYLNLEARFPQAVPPPPEPIRLLVEQAKLNTLVAQADQAIQKKDYAEALKIINAAGQQYSEAFQRHPRARAIFVEAVVGDALERAEKALADGDYAAAESAVDEALLAAPENSAAKALREKIAREWAASLAGEGRRLIDAQESDRAVAHLKIALAKFPNDQKLAELSDEANAHQHLIAAKRELDRGQLQNAVNEIVAARELVFRRSNAAWVGPIRQSLDTLAGQVRDTVCEQARAKADQRQYTPARDHLKIASGLSATDAKVAETRVYIDERAEDPKTANLSGTWQAPPGLTIPGGSQQAPQAFAVQIADLVTGITVKAEQPFGMEGELKRENANSTKLTGTFHFALRNMPNVTADVTANVKDAKTLSVDWGKFRPKAMNRGFELFGREDWMMVQGGN